MFHLDADLIEQAAAIYDASVREETAKQQALAADRLARAVRHVFGVEVPPGTTEIRLGSYPVIGTVNPQRLRLIVPCRLCGEEVRSYYFDSLVTLGEAITDITEQRDPEAENTYLDTTLCTACKPDPDPVDFAPDLDTIHALTPDAEPSLMDAIRALVAEEVQRHVYSAALRR